MNNPFEVLGLRACADAEEVRAAYRALARRYHPDMIQDPAQREEAQARMVQLNLAYEEALRMVTPRAASSAISRDLSEEESIQLAQKMLDRSNPQSALRYLLRSHERGEDWYYVHGKVLMALEQYESAHQSYRQAIRISPEKNLYRIGALEAVLAMRESATLHGRLKRIVKNFKK